MDRIESGLLEIRDLDAGYGKLQILRAVSMSVGEGEVTAIIGANGAGKTTVLKAIMSLLDVMGGEIRLRGVLLNGKPWYRIAQMGVAFVPQRREIFASLTVMENLEVGAYRVRRRKQEVSRNLATVLGYFPLLESKSLLKAGYLSGGEQKMLSIARGLMASPKLILLDEPSLGLAPLVAEALVENIARITRDHPSLQASVVVEQNAFLALEVAHKGYVMEGGRVVLSGPSMELVANPHVKAAYLTA